MPRAVIRQAEGNGGGSSHARTRLSFLIPISKGIRREFFAKYSRSRPRQAPLPSCNRCPKRSIGSVEDGNLMGISPVRRRNWTE